MFLPRAENGKEAKQQTLSKCFFPSFFPSFLPFFLPFNFPVFFGSGGV
jgi:hypothetical protein